MALSLKDIFPIVFHADHLPFPFSGHPKPFVQSSDRGFVIIGVLADGIIMVIQQTHAFPIASGGELKHRNISVRVAVGKDWGAANVQLNFLSLLLTVIDDQDFRDLHDRAASVIFNEL